MLKFQSRYSFDHRKQICTQIREKYPHLIPIIIESHQPTSPFLFKKFLIHKDETIASLLKELRKIVQISSEMGIYIFVGRDQFIPNPYHELKDLYIKHKDPDGFLYITYMRENAFG